MGTGVLTPGIKRPGRQADRLPTSSAEVKRGAITPLTQYVFMAFCLIKQ